MTMHTKCKWHGQLSLGRTCSENRLGCKSRGAISVPQSPALRAAKGQPSSSKERQSRTQMAPNENLGIWKTGALRLRGRRPTRRCTAAASAWPPQGHVLPCSAARSAAAAQAHTRRRLASAAIMRSGTPHTVTIGNLKTVRFEPTPGASLARQLPFGAGDV